MKRIVISALYLLVLFSVSFFLFDPMHLYYEIWWLDIPMHILGGLGVASLASSLHLYFLKTRISFLNLFLAYTAVAILWEVYEYAHDLVTYREWNGWLDTIKDYLDGLLGALIAYKFLMK